MSAPRSTDEIRLDLRDLADVIVPDELRSAAARRLAGDVGPLLDRLADAERISDTASEVYCEITGGKLSYPTYDAKTILTEAGDYAQKLIDEEVDSATSGLAAERDTALAEVERLRRFADNADVARRETHRALNRANAALAAAVAREAALRELLAALTDPDPCWFDHNGNCQAHGWTIHAGGLCGHELAKRALAAVPSPAVTPEPRPWPVLRDVPRERATWPLDEPQPAVTPKPAKGASE